MIAAVAENGVIGKDGKMPWNQPEDLQYFKRETQGHTIVMGKQTFASINYRALPGRETYVLTSNPNEMAARYPHVKFAGSTDEILRLAKTSRKIFICGGGGVYREFLPYADMLYITNIHAEVPGDTFFPKIDKNEWIHHSATPFLRDKKTCTR